ncbi:hypothetical protein GBF38_003704 [Nibea albiflora]|uniref:Uncharacterized protein n=1 Tax=Nibea albiflora TaxID=240163 RepID=A0ACB7F1B8_NIBAL|nr:hypothetical protein GBF38_003704 [Nibea albiflora]
MIAGVGSSTPARHGPFANMSVNETALADNNGRALLAAMQNLSTATTTATATATGPPQATSACTQMSVSRVELIQVTNARRGKALFTGKLTPPFDDVWRILQLVKDDTALMWRSW